tara:strand:+ start:169 stop:525 length:357 start_codon:yes stop_codon:yes gene_type:complete
MTIITLKNYSKYIYEKVKIIYNNRYDENFTITGILVEVPQKIIFNKYTKMLWFSIECIDKKIQSIPLSAVKNIYLIKEDLESLKNFNSIKDNFNLCEDITNYIEGFMEGWEYEESIIY